MNETEKVTLVEVNRILRHLKHFRPSLLGLVDSDRNHKVQFTRAERIQVSELMIQVVSDAHRDARNYNGKEGYNAD